MLQGLCNGTASVCLSHLSAAAAACGGFAAVGPAAAGRPAARRTAARSSAANANSVTSSADVVSWTQSCVSRFWFMCFFYILQRKLMFYSVIKVFRRRGRFRGSSLQIACCVFSGRTTYKPTKSGFLCFKFYFELQIHFKYYSVILVFFR